MVMIFDGHSKKCIMNEYIQEEIDTLKSLDYNKIETIYSSILKAYQIGGRVYLIGNGGSSSNATHWVNDLRKNLDNISNGFDVTCLTDNTSLLTAYANDVSYDDIFIEQVKGCLRRKDLLIALSVSGSSTNLVRVMKYAREVGSKTISIIADYNGVLENVSDVVLEIKTKNYGIAEDIQQSINHIIVQMIRKEFGTNHREEKVC